MAEDIAEWLRCEAKDSRYTLFERALFTAAADEIDRLRAILELTNAMASHLLDEAKERREQKAPQSRANPAADVVVGGYSLDPGTAQDDFGRRGRGRTRSC